MFICFVLGSYITFEVPIRTLVLVFCPFVVLVSAECWKKSVRLSSSGCLSFTDLDTNLF